MKSKGVRELPPPSVRYRVTTRDEGIKVITLRDETEMLIMKRQAVFTKDAANTAKTATTAVCIYKRAKKAGTH